MTRTLHFGEVAVAGIGDPAAYEAWYHTARGGFLAVALYKPPQEVRDER